MTTRIDQVKEPMLRIIRTQRVASLIFIGILILHFFKPNLWNFVVAGFGIIYLGLAGFYIMHMTQSKAGLLYDDWSNPSRLVEQNAPEARSVRVKLWVKNTVILAKGFYFFTKPFIRW